jgi:hypothetical protein
LINPTRFKTKSQDFFPAEKQPSMSVKYWQRAIHQNISK